MNRNQSHQADMEFVDIPGTSIRASRVALGTWAIGGWMWGGSNESDAINATKAGLDWKDGKPFRNASKARIIKEAEDSLRRLQADVIDLYQVHWPDPNTPIAEVADAMGELQRAGKIRAIGVSNFSPAQMDEFRKVAPLHAAQPPYNLFERGIDDDVVPYCRDQNIALLAYGSLCRGLLSGSMPKKSR